jgi:hypothetical protein
MAARRRTSNENLDSLLDTMANVVGILIVLLAVTQISVSDAMLRLSASGGGEPTTAGFEEAEEEAQRLVSLVAERKSQLDELEALRALGESELGGLLPYVERLGGTLEDGEQRGLSLTALEALLGRRRAELERTLPEVVAARAEMAKYDRLRAAPVESAAFKVTRLPDTRPAPGGARAVDVFCRFDRVFFPGLDGLLELRETEMRRAVDTPRGAIPLLPDDRTRIAAHFEAQDIGTDLVRWRFVDAGRRGLISRLEWRSREIGETAPELVASSSTYRAQLAGIDPAHTFFRFHVWSDSFDAYLRARAVATEAGFAASWIPYDRNLEPQMNMLSPPPPLPREVD